jgi:hypothetical protein
MCRVYESAFFKHGECCGIDNRSGATLRLEVWGPRIITRRATLRSRDSDQHTAVC